MARNRIHGDNADRQRAYRDRLKSGATQAIAKRRRPPSRPLRLARVTLEVQTLALEYEHWLTALPESLQESELGTRLTEVVEQLTGVAELLADIDPPKGFGRD